MSVQESELNTTPGQQAYDAIVVGAGHNGLATATVLARQGQRVLVLEKNAYVGGMGGTREILKGCRNEVGASCLFPLSKEIKDYFQFEENGVELIPLPVMAVNLSGPNSRPLIFYKNPLKVVTGVCRHFGLGAMLGFIRFIQFCAYPAQVLDRFTARKAPRSLQELIAEAPNERKRAQLELAFYGSAMDVINKFFPDKVKHKELRSSLAFAAVQATYKGPYSKGSGMCLIYTMAQEGSEGMMQRVKGGLGKLSESLVERLEAMGSTVLLKKQVSKILLENNRAVGVELKNGERFYANVVVSNLDKPATFDHLLQEHAPAPSVRQRIDKFEHKGAFMHLLFKLKSIPEYGGEFEQLNNIPFSQFGGAMVHDPDDLQASFESCQQGEIPKKIPLAFQFPSLMDETLAPEGFHVASAYAFYFPCDAEKSEKGKLRDQFAERVIDQISAYMPKFRELIVDKAAFSAEHFATMEGATNGDWTHGLLHPDQMVGDRSLLDEQGHSTPFENLFLCGASCHPGPGVTFLPGYNCAHEILERALPFTESSTESSSNRSEAIDCAA